MGQKISIVGGAGAIGLVHAWMLAAAGHTVTILDSRQDGYPGASFNNLLNAPHLFFRFLEMDRLIANLPEGGMSVDAFKEQFVRFPSVFQSRIHANVEQVTQPLTQNDCIQIIQDTLRLPMNSIHLAQASDDIKHPQDIIVVTVKCAALTSALGHKIKAIPQSSSTPVVIFANGMLPWIKPEPDFAGLRIQSLSEIYDFVHNVGTEKVKAGVLIKYGAAIDGNGEFCVRSPFFNTRNSIANINTTDITPDLKLVSDVYTEAGIKTEPTDKINYIMLEKLNYNLTGSIMGAIFNYKMGELVCNQGTKNAVEACAKELYQLANALNIQLANSEIEFVNQTIDALQKNSEVVSSPLQDIRAGRRTEKEFLVKAAIELAQTYQIAMPVLQAMYDLITRIEDKACVHVEQGRMMQESILNSIAERDIVSIAQEYHFNKSNGGLSIFSSSPKKDKKNTEESVLSYSI